jgi:hypothetical protein
MALSTADQELLANMRQREIHVKKRQRAANSITYETKRYRGTVLAVVAVLTSAVITGILIAVDSSTPEWPEVWRTALLVPVAAAIGGALIGSALLRTRRGRRLIASKEGKLRRKYSGDLHAGRKWLPFYYDGEDIGPYVPQILYAIDSEQRFDSVQDALEYTRSHVREAAASTAEELETFNAVASETNVVVVSSVDEAGRPSSRVMRFVTTDRPGVWYVTTAPDSPKVSEFDRGRVALITAPTPSGATINSNRVRVRRADLAFADIADLYQAQVPGYTEGMTDDEQERELVYELTLQSAKVETWTERDVVVFAPPGQNRGSVSNPEPGGQ